MSKRIILAGILLFVLLNCSNEQTTDPHSNSIPQKPHSPVPTDSSTGLIIPVELSWQCADDDGNPLCYKLWLGNCDTLALIAQELIESHYMAENLSDGWQYYWQVEASDQQDSILSDIWTFSTLDINYPPLAPHSPSPADLGEDIIINPCLNWSCSDPDADSLEYDLYFGTAEMPSLVAINIHAPFQSQNLSYDSVYYWRISARDHEFETFGDVWSFHTQQTNNAPFSAYNPFPSSGADNIMPDQILSWSGYDPDGDVLSYSIYFGDTVDPPLQVEHQTMTEFQPDLLEYDDTYYWKVDSYDGCETTAGVLWSFHTVQLNIPPANPHSPFPEDNAVQVSLNSILIWQCEDENNDILTYDVYLGDTIIPPLVSSDQYGDTYQPEELNFATDYYWKITASDGEYQTEGLLWHFRTAGGNLPPLAPFDPQPADNSTLISPNTALNWQCSDPDGDDLYFDVYLGLDADPPVVSSHQVSNVYQPVEFLQENSRYYWHITASDGEIQTDSELWTFFTGETGNNQPPDQPQVIFPADGLEDAAINTQLSWQCNDPNGDILIYNIYLSIDDPPVQVETGFTGTTFDPGELDYETTYYWQIEAGDGEYLTSSDIWSFSTEAGILPIELVPVTGGVFNMGNAYETGNQNELPVHPVDLDDFLISRFEITQAEWEIVMNNNPPQGAGVGPDFPVFNVSWVDALEFCNQLSNLEGFTPCYIINGIESTCDFTADGYRLPTEAEWEWAARGALDPPDYLYAGSDEIYQVAVFRYDNPGSCQQVGSKNANELELFDMSGNIWEWCWDWYAFDYYDFCFEQGTVTNPTGPEVGIYRLIKGGGWGSTAFYCRVPIRHTYYPDSAGNTIGFRICRNATE